MKTVGAYEAKTNFPKLLERVARGEAISITKHGVPVPTLLPADATKGKPVRETIEQLKQLRRNHRLGALSIRAMLKQGRP